MEKEQKDHGVQLYFLYESQRSDFPAVEQALVACGTLSTHSLLHSADRLRRQRLKRILILRSSDAYIRLVEQHPGERHFDEELDRRF
ncbi:MAG: hypothetical protein NVS2B12_19520 [Ktedonobacteraceae bacterium]